MSQPIEERPYVVIPTGTLARTIAPGSGVVARKTSDDKWQLHYEGNLYDAINLKRFADRVWCAYSRQITKYPTIATLHWPDEDFVIVGTFDPDLGTVTVLSPDADRQINEWIAPATTQDGTELEATGSKFEWLRTLTTLPAHERARIAQSNILSKDIVSSAKELNIL
jgi:hypothetical protein